MRVPRVGIVGGGQLARMSCQAAIPLGLQLRILAEHADDSAALVAPEPVIGRPDDLAALDAFAQGCDVVTFDHELVPPDLMSELERRGHCLRPSAATKLLAQDKLHQRRELSRLGLPVPAFAACDLAPDASGFAADNGWPVVLKAARGGYDGRGVWIVDGPAALDAAFAEAARVHLPVLAEALVPLDRELATMVARNPSGEMAVYPLVETVQDDGMCREVLAPATVDAATAARAEALARQLAEASGLVGLLAVELFVDRSGNLLVNEVAARPHNSGHYSIEGCVTSQFENHLRAILEWPLGDTSLTAPAVATVNVVGESEADPRALLPRALAVPGVHVHLYGKGPRPGRKLGHVTALGDDAAEVRARALRAAAALNGHEFEAAR